jgi:hypothetical protein
VSGLREKIITSRELADWIGSQVEGRSLKADLRRRLGAALLSVCLAHHAAVVDLYEGGRYSSALALIRSMIDALARSLWVAYVAADEQVDAFVEGHNPPKSPDIIASLETAGILDSDELSRVMKPIWPVVCDFNHGGGRMVVRHLSGTEIAPQFKDDELEEALVVADQWALGAACALADLMEDRELGDRFLERHSSR